MLGLAGIGLALVYAPEFVFLRDNFGTRMNTVFKFYYQAWLLFGLAGGYTAIVALSRWRGWRLAPALLSLTAILLAVATSVYLVAGAYSKTRLEIKKATGCVVYPIAGKSTNALSSLVWFVIGVSYRAKWKPTTSRPKN